MSSQNREFLTTLRPWDDIVYGRPLIFFQPMTSHWSTGLLSCDWLKEEVQFVEIYWYRLTLVHSYDGRILNDLGFRRSLWETISLNRKKIQSNLAIRNFLVTLELFLNAKCSPFLWCQLTISHEKWFLNTNLFLIKQFLIAKFDCTTMYILQACRSRWCRSTLRFCQIS